MKVRHFRPYHTGGAVRSRLARVLISVSGRSLHGRTGSRYIVSLTQRNSVIGPVSVHSLIMISRVKIVITRRKGEISKPNILCHVPAAGWSNPFVFLGWLTGWANKLMAAVWIPAHRYSENYRPQSNCTVVIHVHTCIKPTSYFIYGDMLNMLLLESLLVCFSRSLSSTLSNMIRECHLYSAQARGGFLHWAPFAQCSQWSELVAKGSN